jgi:biopolymer transport protein ExbD
MSKKHHALDVEIGELNLVPYMDIMVNLIMFMLVSMTTFVEMKIINVSVPQIQDAPSANKPNENPNKQLAVILGIVDKKGFFITLDGTFLEGTPEGGVTVPVKPDGTYDYDTLTQKMMIVKSKQPDLTALTIIPDRTVDYNTLVKTMDAIRRDPQQKVLFPDVLLGVQ